MKKKPSITSNNNLQVIQLFFSDLILDQKCHSNAGPSCYKDDPNKGQGDRNEVATTSNCKKDHEESKKC